MVDRYVIADDLNYIKQGWINRNYILLCGRPFMFHLALIEASINKKINEIYVAEEQSKLLKTIEVNYKKAPCFNQVFPMIESIIRYEDRNLGRFVGNSIVKIADYLRLDTEFIYNSEHECEQTLKGQDLLISNCLLYGAKTYINAIGGMELYDKDTFKKAGIDLFFLKAHPIKYKQFNHTFIPNLSILDVLMFNSVEETNDLLTQFELL